MPQSKRVLRGGFNSGLHKVKREAALSRVMLWLVLPRQAAGFVLVATASATAMLALGLLIGAVAPTARSAGAAGTVLFFPLMYFAGLWTPQLSPATRHIGQFTPLGASAQALALALDPYPRAKGVTVPGIMSEKEARAAASPFAALKKG